MTTLLGDSYAHFEQMGAEEKGKPLKFISLSLWAIIYPSVPAPPRTALWMSSSFHMVVGLATSSVYTLGLFIGSHSQPTTCEVQGMQRASLALSSWGFGLEREQAWIIN